MRRLFATLFAYCIAIPAKARRTLAPEGTASRTPAWNSGPAVACVEKAFIDRLKGKPYPNRIMEHYNAAFAACK